MDAPRGGDRRGLRAPGGSPTVARSAQGVVLMRRWLVNALALALALTACGTTVLARKIEPAAAPSIEPSARATQLTGGGQGDVNLDDQVPGVVGSDPASRCGT